MGLDWQSPNGSPVGIFISVDASEQQTQAFQCDGASTSTVPISFAPFCGSSLGPTITGTFEGTDYVGTIPIDCTGTGMVGGYKFAVSAKGLLEVNNGFSVHGSNSSTIGQAGKQDGGSAAGARYCKTWLGQITYKAAEALGKSILATWQRLGYTTAVEFLAYFLSGQGLPMDLPDTSPTATEIKRSTEFTAENKAVLTYIKQQLDGGATQIQLPAPDPLHTFAFLNRSTEPDLYLAFRYTHGLTVQGGGSLIGSNYIGTLTYVITESYGFN